MATEAPFYMWSIAEAWGWLIHQPGLGLALFFLAGFALLAALLITVVTFIGAIESK